MPLHHGTLYGQIRQEGRVLRARHTGLFQNVIALMFIPFTGLIAVLLLFQGLRDGNPFSLIVVPTLAVQWLIIAFFLGFRLRRMGRITVDAEHNTLVFVRFGREAGRWPLEQVRFGRAWDPRMLPYGMHYWLTAKVPDGRRLRLYRARNKPINDALELLKAWGATVDR